MSLEALRARLLGPDAAVARISEIRGRVEAAKAPVEGSFSAALSRASSPGESRLRTMADDAARAAGVDPKLFAALVESESGWDPASTSGAGAMGLTQLMPGTARELGVTQPYDPGQNLAGGAKYLRSLLDRFGDERLAVAAYNAGPGAVQRAGGVPAFPETQEYVRRVMARRG